MENARQESECIMKDAQERAEELREEIIKKAQDEAAAEIESARMAGAEKESSAKAAYEAETSKAQDFCRRERKRSGGDGDLTARLMESISVQHVPDS